MKAELVTAASNVVRNPQILVNMVSRRVRQLTLGHRPLIEFAPGLGHADIALTEIANGKLEFEFNSGQGGNTEVVEFPVIVSEKSNLRTMVQTRRAKSEDIRENSKTPELAYGK
jgi:DNA-directed RNA polymerase subunit omega